MTSEFSLSLSPNNLAFSFSYSSSFCSKGISFLLLIFSLACSSISFTSSGLNSRSISSLKFSSMKLWKCVEAEPLVSFSKLFNALILSLFISTLSFAIWFAINC